MSPQSYGYNGPDPDLLAAPQSTGAQQQTTPPQIPGITELAAPRPSMQSVPINPFSPQPLSSAAASPVSSAPMQAEDADLIENEWVDVAKKIIEGSRGDPFNQSNGMTMLRADYMKKRYNKDIKIPEN